MRKSDPGEDPILQGEYPGPAPHYGPEGPSPLMRAVRIVVPWIGLIIVVTVLWSVVSEYRIALNARSRETGGAIETSGTVGPDGLTIPAGEPYVRVKTEGLNMRSEPSTTGAVLKTLTGGQLLVYLESQNGWFRVKDAAGTEGWVAAGGSFTELVQPE